MGDFLQKLLSDDFYMGVGVISSARALRRCLYQSETVDELRRAIAGGVITENAIEDFVNQLMKDFERGKRFPHELPLAAIAVAIEDRKTKFTEDYLLDLARLNKITEMSISPEVAGASLKRWYLIPRVSVSTPLTRSTAQDRERHVEVNRIKHYWRVRTASRSTMSFQHLGTVPKQNPYFQDLSIIA
jgi:hypothetical protein